MGGSFDVLGPLPTGTLLLEASAGTGKTWTIAALVARHVAEGITPLEQMLIVTFSRSATQELRNRVRDRLTEVESALVSGDTGDDPLLALLVDVPDEERERRLARVRAALTGFDAAAILTIHQFCDTVLRGLGVAGDSDPGMELVESLDDLLDEVVDDLYLRLLVDGAPAFTLTQARDLAREAALANGLARLEPRDADPRSFAGQYVDFGERVRVEFARRKRRLGVMSYDDLLDQLANALAEPDSVAGRRMRERWRFVLVDEFQDTDEVQWQVFDRAFGGAGEPPTTMVLIGDPKQAIYAFRGGDVETYLRARESATEQATLTTNFRADDALVARLNELLGGAQLGHPAIVVADVGAQHADRRIIGPVTEPVRLRALTRNLAGPLTDDGSIPVGQARARIADDVAADIQRILTDGTEFVDESGPRPIQPADIAVLAYSRFQLGHVRDALERRGIASVVTGSGSVFQTAAARQWLTLLEALEQPHRFARVRAVALTPFFGYSLPDLVAGGDELTEKLADSIRTQVDLFRAGGVAAVFEAAVLDGLDARLLGTVDGERDLTDLRHLAELLHREAIDRHVGLVALLTWLRDEIRDAHLDSDDRTRRLDADSEAVQLVTIHQSKGLEYPIVYVPFAFDAGSKDVEPFLSLHDENGDRVLYVAPKNEREDRWDALARREDRGERLRLLYVAVTRAQAQLTLWWAPTSKNTPNAELHRLLFGRRHREGAIELTAPLRNDAEAVQWLRAWEAHGAFALQQAVPGDDSAPVAASEPAALGVRRFTGFVDLRWKRTSYSALAAAAGAHGAGVDSEPDVEVKDDEPEEPTELSAGDVVGGIPSPMADLPSGTLFGSLVHAVLEHADPDAPLHGGDLRAELRRVIDEQWLAWPQDVDRELLADALVAVCETPLGPAADGVTLRQIPVRDRLPELDFEIPLGGGDDAPSRGGPRLADIAPLLRSHLPEGDPVRAWAAALDDPALGDQDLRGYLGGSIDIAMRVGQRYLVVDYKTNWLGRFDQPLTSADYAPDRLDAAMGHSDYPLQALLYSVVLHRFLRWRLPGYDPEVHLGGVLYLYLRGMCGPETPIIDGNPCGVFTWQPPAGLVTDLSDLLDGGAR